MESVWYYIICLNMGDLAHFSDEKLEPSSLMDYYLHFTFTVSKWLQTLYVIVLHEWVARDIHLQSKSNHVTHWSGKLESPL